MEVTTNIEIEKENKLLNDKISILEDTLSNLNLDKNKEESETNELDYSKILYYSLVFNQNEYDKILSLVYDNTNIFGIYKLKTPEQIESIMEKQNDNGYDVEKDFANIISKLALGDNFAIKYNENKNIVQNKNNFQSQTLFKLNDKFHTTMLYLGGKKDIKALELEPHVGCEIKAKIVSIGISNKFIVCGIEFVDKTIPYYGNPIQHITIGLKKTESNKFKLFPKDSPTAFEEGVKISFTENQIEITGKLVKECKDKKK